MMIMNSLLRSLILKAPKVHLFGILWHRFSIPLWSSICLMMKSLLRKLILKELEVHLFNIPTWFFVGTKTTSLLRSCQSITSYTSFKEEQTLRTTQRKRRYFLWWEYCGCVRQESLHHTKEVNAAITWRNVLHKKQRLIHWISIPI